MTHPPVAADVVNESAGRDLALDELEYGPVCQHAFPLTSNTQVHAGVPMVVEESVPVPAVVGLFDL